MFTVKHVAPTDHEALIEAAAVRFQPRLDDTPPTLFIEHPNGNFSEWTSGSFFVMNEKDRSSKIVISTGMMLPRWPSVAALYCLTKSMMLTPCGPRAVPTGGAGVAAPAGSCTLTSAATFFFFGGIAVVFLSDL